MTCATDSAKVRPVHPFAARMAPPIVWNVIPRNGKRLAVLDPMSGSGTTIVCARSKGHHAIGCDTDPLALLMSQVWSSDLEPKRLEERAKLVLDRSISLSIKLDETDCYPSKSDTETRSFINFWFDAENRKQLSALATSISRVKSKRERDFLWCAFSRMIVTKSCGASLAMDVSHSRPHKSYSVAPLRAFDGFIKSVSKVIASAPFKSSDRRKPEAIVKKGDARALPISSSSIDLIVTSPPYLNAIDYLRGHKLSLVWMGYSISELRKLRSSNIGSEVGAKSTDEKVYEIALNSMGDCVKLSNRDLGIVNRYLLDMGAVMKECARVLKQNGRAIFVVGDSSVRGVFLKNSSAIKCLGENAGFKVFSTNTRPIEPSRRYLPPPEAQSSGKQMQSRMREEVIIEFRK